MWRGEAGRVLRFESCNQRKPKTLLKFDKNIPTTLPIYQFSSLILIIHTPQTSNFSHHLIPIPLSVSVFVSVLISIFQTLFQCLSLTFIFNFPRLSLPIFNHQNFMNLFVENIQYVKKYSIHITAHRSSSQ